MKFRKYGSKNYKQLAQKITFSNLKTYENNPITSRIMIYQHRGEAALRKHLREKAALQVKRSSIK